jgi:hypothetical protein
MTVIMWDGILIIKLMLKVTSKAANMDSATALKKVSVPVSTPTIHNTTLDFLLSAKGMSPTRTSMK